MPKKTDKAASEYAKFFQRLADEFGYKIPLRGDPSHLSLQRQGFPISISCDRVGDTNAFVSLYIRTTSWEFDGERTDIHDIISVLVCCFLRAFSDGISCRIWDMENPAVPVPKTELYARYVTLEQPSNSLFSVDAKGYKALSNILGTISLFGMLLPRMFEHIEVAEDDPSWEPYDYQGPIISRWAKTVAKSLNQKISSHQIQYNLRRNPCWYYYRSIRPGVSVLYAPHLTLGLRAMIETKTSKIWEIAQGTKGSMYVSKDAKNFISFAIQKRALGLAHSLKEGLKNSDIRLIPLENCCVAVAMKHVFFFKADSGRGEYEREKESLRYRHQQERALLFPPSKILWKKNVSEDAFEELILDLLVKEPGVIWARKMGHTNEPDGGRDIIAEWDTSPVPGQILEEGQSSVIRRRVIIQCKASKHAIGKAHVRDIYDLLKRYDATGYFLSISSYATTGLIGHLEKLRYHGGYWSDWWTKTEIEDRLIRNESIALKYPNLFTIRRDP
jgi:hypothetical protein